MAARRCASTKVEVIDSNLDVRQLRLVLAWAELVREELLENWVLARRVGNTKFQAAQAGLAFRVKSGPKVNRSERR